MAPSYATLRKLGHGCVRAAVYTSFPTSSADAPRSLHTAAQREAIAARFWEVGRLTLEHWLTPRLDWAGIHRWPGAEVLASPLPAAGPSYTSGSRTPSA